jgi:hypothetical protein
MEALVTSTILRILQRLNPVLGSAKWNLPIVDDRTHRRWLRDGEDPTPGPAKAVGVAIWRQISAPGEEALRRAVFARIREVVPDAPCESWNEELFGAWFYELAEQARGLTVHGAGTSPLVAAVDLLVRNSGQDRFISVFDKPSLLPVRQGDELQLCVRLHRPAYICMVWVDQNGKPFPMHPWNWAKADWNHAIVQKEEQAISVPDSLTSTGRSRLSVNGAPGVETLVVMVDRQPPTDAVLKNLPNWLSRCSVPRGDLGLRLPFSRTFPRSESRGYRASVGRGPLVLVQEDPLADLHDALGQCLAEHFDETVTFSFANGGPRAASREK